MKKAYYREQALERIARDVITAYDPRLYYGSPVAIPIEDIIEAQGLVLEYQYLRNNGRVLGETIFDDGLTAIYDWENHRYDLLPVKGGTILIDCSLCEEEASTGRLRSGRTNQQLVTDMAGIFQVSKQAMRIRLENHNLL